MGLAFKLLYNFINSDLWQSASPFTKAEFIPIFGIASSGVLPYKYCVAQSIIAKMHSMHIVS